MGRFLMSSMSRRGAFTVVGAGFIATLTACSSQNKDAAPSASASAKATSPSHSTASVSASATPSGPSFKGELKLENYRSSGEFEPGTQEHPAQHVPVPVEPAKLREDSVEGLHAFVTYWLATLNYMLLTGDGNYFTNIDHTGDYTTIADFMQDMYASETGWVTGVQNPLTMSLDTDHPTKDEKNGFYTWKTTMKVNRESAVYTKTTNRSQPLPEVFKVPSGVVSGQVTAHYLEGTWRMVHRAPASAGASASAQGSASADGENK